MAWLFVHRENIIGFAKGHTMTITINNIGTNNEMMLTIEEKAKVMAKRES